MPRFNCEHCGHTVYCKDLDFNGGELKTRVVEKATEISPGIGGVRHKEHVFFRFSCPKCHRTSERFKQEECDMP